MGVLQRWFNVSPGKDSRPIINDRAKRYWATWFEDIGKESTLMVTRKEKGIGLAELLWQVDNILMLADIRVFHKSDRGHGLGTAMLQDVIRLVKEHRAALLWGYVQPEEGMDKERLAHWYRAQGFVVTTSKLGALIATMTFTK